MRPRGRGDDVEYDDDDDEYEDITPPRRTPGPEGAPAPAPPQPARAPLSSLVVRPPPQDNDGGSSPPSPSARSPSPSASGHRGRGALPSRRRRDFSPPTPRGWERRRSPPPPLPLERRRPGSPLQPQRRRFSPPPRLQRSRHPRFHEEQQGYMHAGPSPPRPRRAEAIRFDDDVGSHYTHGYQGDGRVGARFRGSPPYGRGGRSYGRGYGAPHGKDLINIDGQYVHRNDPNLSPREGDWICQNPICGNLNFARRTHCNNCNKFRNLPHEAYEPRRSPPFRSYPSPPRGPPRMVGPPGDRAPARETTRYRAPPHGWGASDPRAYAARSPPERVGRFTDPSPKERMGFHGERGPRDRAKLELSATDDYIQRERPRDDYLDRSRHHSGSPRGSWGNDLRDRSRSPPQNRPMKSSFTNRGRPADYAADPYARRGRPNGIEAGHGRGHVYRAGSDPYLGEDRGDRAARARNEDGY